MGIDGGTLGGQTGERVLSLFHPEAISTQYLANVN